MPIYEIEQYELHAQTYRIEAETEAEAIRKLLEGHAEPIDDGLEYIEVADKYGLPIDNHQTLSAELQALEIRTRDNVIPSIRAVRQIA